jgi:hypothetical protein
VFDRTVGFDGVPDGDEAMDDRDELRVMVTPWAAGSIPDAPRGF